MTNVNHVFDVMDAKYMKWRDILDLANGIPNYIKI